MVSNNRRNKKLGDVLTVRLTTSSKPSIPSIVELGPTEAMARINAGMTAALELPIARG